MRGRVEKQGDLFYSFQPNDLVPATHPLREIKKRADSELQRLRKTFEAAYSRVGRPSIPPEQLIKALLLQALYSIRSERQLCEQIGYNLLFRWFLDLAPDASVWNPTTFTKNRDRFAEHGFLQKFFQGTVAKSIEEGAVDTEHFSVDGTLIQSWASLKSFRPRDDDDQDRPDANSWASWKGEKRSNKTHESKTDPEAMLARRSDGQGAQLCHSLHVLMENENALMMDVSVAEATNQSEREQAVEMTHRFRRRYWMKPKTLGADKGYDDGKFLHELESDMGIVPHVATRAGPMKAKDDGGEARRRARRRKKTKGYRRSQRVRKQVEPVIGWLKQVAELRRVRFVGRWKTQLYAYAAGAAYNLMRLGNLSTA